MSSSAVSRNLLVLFMVHAAISAANGDEPVADSPRPVRLRVEWGCPTAQAWNGVVEVSHGRFEQPSSLGVEADEPGTIWTEGGAVWFQRRSPRIYDGFDVTVIAQPDATLNITLQAAGNETIREQFAINIAEIRKKPKTVRNEQENLRLIVRRTPGDNLPVRIEKPHLIFAPQEQFTATVSVEAPWNFNRNVTSQLTWQLCAARSERVLSKQSIPVDFEQAATSAKQVPVTVPLPRNEGAYDICFIETRNGREANRRSVQVLVLADKPQDSHEKNTDETSAELVDSFRPGNVHLFRHITPRSNRKAIGEAVSNLFSFMPVPRAGETDNGDETSEKVQWDAYKLRVKHPGRPHRLTVFANSAHSQNLGISLLEPNAAGQLMPVGLDSGLYVFGADSVRAPSGEVPTAAATHDLIIWPKVKEPILLFHDMGTGTPLDVERVELHEFESLPRESATPATPQTGVAHRLVGPSMHVPLLPENFGATEGFDSESGRSLDDWTTFYAAATRAADYLHFAGYNSLMLSVLADGSTIYPSTLLQPTPRYDTGVFFSSGQDPMRKDVLELMFRIFDRDRLTLVPLAQFSTPLPVLERAITDDANRAAGIELIGRDGKSWRETHASTRGRAPYYNPLNSQVQQAVIDVMAELASRYHSHESFAGIAVELGGSGYLQLPGLEWGLDDETVGRFEKFTGIQLPGGDDSRFQKRFELLTTKYSSQWNRWRCEELARFHRRLADTIAAQKPDARLILAAKDLFEGDHSDVEEAVRSGQKLDELLTARGLDFKLYGEASNIIVLRPAQWRSPDRPRTQAVDDTLSYSPSLNPLFANCRQGSLFFHSPHECRLSDFDEVSPWQPAYTWLASQALVAGVENRRRYAMSLAAGDAQMVFDGGWLLPMGQEHPTRRLREVIAQLPAIPFYLNKLQHQPVTVRMARQEGTSWIYVVNEVPHAVDVTLDLSCSTTVDGRILPNDESLSLIARDEGSSERIHLDSYDVWACRISDKSVNIDAVNAVLPETSKSELATRIKRLDQRIALVRSDAQKEKSPIENPGFEEHSNAAGELPGWELPVQNAAQWRLDDSNPRSGNTSLLLTSADDNLAALSSPLPVDESRLLTMLVWLRSDRAAADVRLVFSADVAGRPHTRFVPVRVDKEWRHYVFRVTDIPTEKLESATVRIEMRGPGKLWIDDVDIRRNRLAPEDLRQLTKISSAVTIAWDEGRYADCERLLDGYWGQLPFDEPQPGRKPQHEPSRTAEGLRKLFRRQ